MRPVPSRILFSVLGACAIALGVVTGQKIFFIVAALLLLLLATSLATSRLPLTRALGRFRDQPVEVRLWGAAPPGTAGTTFILTSVNVMSVGTHLFFTAYDGSSAHLKIAQPRDAKLPPDHVTVATARYVQWNTTKLERNDTAVAVSIALKTSSASEASPDVGTTAG
ncbi:MAG TPA: hypothetical protein VGJ81_21475 [Thermoanaerobaculia bacterium]|jgi:hypothetical protein